MLWTYFIGKHIAKNSSAAPKRARHFLILGVTGNLGTLAYFKYFNFGLENLNSILELLGAEPFASWNIILPIGVSFYIFQATSYLIDVYRNDAPPAKNFWDLSAFIALFPQLIAGPILRYKDVAAQFNVRSHSWEMFSEGATRFMLGFCKKVLIADAVAPLVTMTFSYSEPGFTGAWLGALAYTLQLYFDFSAYSDMAIGLGLMMGFRFMENFNHPYISQSITAFWQRWHISLSRWLRDYLYIPLGGNRKGVRRTYINLSLVMLLGGLWHGASWTFVLWGVWHGSLLVLERFLACPQRWHTLPAWLSVPRTFLLIVTGWVMFRAESIAQAFDIYRAMFSFEGFTLGETVAWQVSGFSITMFMLGYLLVFTVPWLQTKLKSSSRTLHSPLLASAQLIILPLFVLATMRLSAQAFSPFLYFQF